MSYLETWDLRPVWSGKVPTSISSTAEIARIKSPGTRGLRCSVNRPLIIRHSRAGGDSGRGLTLVDAKRLKALMHCQKPPVTCSWCVFLITSLIIPSLHSSPGRLPELPARPACNFQICTVERFPGLAADIKSKSQRSLCSNHGVTGNSGAARVLSWVSSDCELIAYLLIATIPSR